MTPPNSCIVEGRKFVWDGKTYPSREEAETAKAGYEEDRFETCTREEEGQFLVYTRRAVEQVTVDGPQ